MNPPRAELPPPDSLPEALELLEWYARRDDNQVVMINDLIEENERLAAGLAAAMLINREDGRIDDRELDAALRRWRHVR